jgi:2-methylisocitrate lyase-like PEP mutase family enzyme
MDQPVKAARFRKLHIPGTPLLMPNAWDPGAAKLLASLEFDAVATTSSGAAATLGRLDGEMSADEALDSATAIASATDIPVSADLEDLFAPDLAGVAANVERAIAGGLAGGSIEDFNGEIGLYPIAVAAERVAAAAQAADGNYVLTARAENHLRGVDDLDDTITRLKAYSAAGADVLYAPGLGDLDVIRRLVAAVDKPVNVLLRPGLSVAELADAGVARVSLGGALAFVALEAAIGAAAQFRDEGTFPYDRMAAGRKAAIEAFGDS